MWRGWCQRHEGDCTIPGERARVRIDLMNGAWPKRQQEHDHRSGEDVTGTGRNGDVAGADGAEQNRVRQPECAREFIIDPSRGSCAAGPPRPP